MQDTDGYKSQEINGRIQVEGGSGEQKGALGGFWDSRQGGYKGFTVFP